MEKIEAFGEIERIARASTVSSGSLNTLELSFYEVGGKYWESTNEYYRKLYVKRARINNDIALKVEIDIFLFFLGSFVQLQKNRRI